MKYAYFPGCSQESTAEEYNRSLQAVAGRLEALDLVELPDWNCCGATPAATVNSLLPHALAARNLAIAEEMGMEIVAPCAACYKNMNKASHTLNDDPDLRAQINRTLDGHQVGRVPRVRHPLDVLVNDVGVDNVPVKSRCGASKWLATMAVCSPGPKAGLTIEHPQSMDRLMEALGAEAVDWPYKTKCCGGGIYMATEDVSFAMRPTSWPTPRRPAPTPWRLVVPSASCCWICIRTSWRLSRRQPLTYRSSSSAS